MAELLDHGPNKLGTRRVLPGRFDVDTSKPLKRRAAHIRGPWLRAKSGAGAQRASQVLIPMRRRTKGGCSLENKLSSS
jgi:hypothetical protein